MPIDLSICSSLCGPGVGRICCFGDADKTKGLCEVE